LRTIKALAIIAAPAFVLAGCAAAETQTEAGSTTLCDPAVSGEASEVVSVSGEKDGEIELSFPTPLNTENSQTTIIQEGEGRDFTGEALSRFQYSIYNGASGELIGSTGFEGDQLAKVFATTESVPNFCNVFAGIPSGSSFVTVFAPGDFHDGLGNPDFGISAEDSVVMYVELEEIAYPRATGEQLAQAAGFPTVVLTPEGQPGIQPLIEGSGEEISTGDVVNVHYSGWTWDGVQFDSSWERGAPAEFTVSQQALIEGFVRALEGVKVGSQVIAIIPPELGYGDAGTGSIPGGATLVFVVDVLSID
jgi:peptidylprolyl isomerase